MLVYIFTVFQKILGLFLMIAAGYACGKLSIISEDGAKEMTSVLFYVVTPCLIVSSLQSTIGQINMEHLLLSFIFSAAAMIICIATGMPFFRRQPAENKKILRFAASYSNSGFIGLPIAQAMLCSRGVTYASVFIVAFNLFCWTHGLALMRGDSKYDWKRAFLNPGIIGFVIGLPFFAAGIRLPQLVLSPVQYLSDLNTPLAMIVVGTYVSRIRLRELFTEPRLYVLSAIRLLLAPALCLLCFVPFRSGNTAVLLTALICCAAPSGANTVMFAAQFGGDVRLSSKTVACTTVFSLLTMPLFLAAGAFLFEH